MLLKNLFNKIRQKTWRLHQLVLFKAFYLIRIFPIIARLFYVSFPGRCISPNLKADVDILQISLVKFAVNFNPTILSTFYVFNLSLCI